VVNEARRRVADRSTEAQRKALEASKVKPKYSKKNPPPGKSIGTPISKADWEKMYRKNRNYSEHD
jgi:hypothetical protein